MYSNVSIDVLVDVEVINDTLKLFVIDDQESVRLDNANIGNNQHYNHAVLSSQV